MIHKENTRQSIVNRMNEKVILKSNASITIILEAMFAYTPWVNTSYKNILEFAEIELTTFQGKLIPANIKLETSTRNKLTVFSFSLDSSTSSSFSLLYFSTATTKKNTLSNTLHILKVLGLYNSI